MDNKLLREEVLMGMYIAIITGFFLVCGILFYFFRDWVIQWITDNKLKPMSESGFKYFGEQVQHYEEKYEAVDTPEDKKMFATIYKMDIASQLVKKKAVEYKTEEELKTANEPE